MASFFDTILDFIRDAERGWVMANLTDMFGEVNSSVSSIAGETAQTPQTWNPAIFSVVRDLSDTVIIPIAGIVIAYVLIYELISMIIDKNNMHEFDSGFFFRYIFKACVAVMLLSKTGDIVMGVFDLGGFIVQKATAVIQSDATVSVSDAVQTIFRSQLLNMSFGELLALGLETSIVKLGIKIMSVLITVILYGRMIEIYLYVSVAPLPFATFTNREWGSIGQNYLKGILALAFQGFFIMVCVSVYAALVANLAETDNLIAAIWEIGAYTVVLCFALFKTASVSRSIFNAH